ncbi:MAG: hypothetical protein ACYTHM_16375 [Planctomycetota bacterium]|jgi:hypothetical protein
MAQTPALLGLSFQNVLFGGIRETGFQVIGLLFPFFLVGLILHGLERAVQKSLARHFGWGSILWTGWLGTPVHELSHAFLCLVFAHRIEEMALFKPDKESGRMGYVKHSWNPQNPYAVVGNFFIGIAPLVGGALVLFLFLWVFFPAAARGAVSGSGIMASLAGGDLFGAGQSVARMVSGVLRHVVTGPNLASWQFWVFLYLVLCVGSHLAPSPADYRGASRGAIVLLLLLLGFNWAFLAFGGEPGGLVHISIRLLGPALALFILAAVLNGGIALLVLGFAAGLDWVKGSGGGAKGSRKA